MLKMAVIKTGQVVSEIRGKLGGSVFGRNKSGAFVRMYVKPNDPQTTAQTVNRGSFGTLSSRWRALNAAEQQSFRDAAPNYPYVNSVGDVIQIGPSQLYQTVNSTLVVEGSGLPKPDVSTIATTPPTLTVMSWAPEAMKQRPMLVSGQEFVAGGDPLVHIPGGNPSIKLGEVYTVYASPVVSAGISNPSGLEFRPIWSAELDGGTSSVTVPGFSNIFELRFIYFFYKNAYPIIPQNEGVVFFNLVSFMLGNYFPFSKGILRAPVVPAP
jgi:hypothetical protein